MARPSLPPERRYRVVRHRDDDDDRAPYAVLDLCQPVGNNRNHYGYDNALVWLRTHKEVDALRSKAKGSKSFGIFADFVPTLETALRLLKRKRRLSSKTMRSIRARAHMEILGDTIDTK